MRQFVRGKPNPVGLKNFVMTTPKGVPLDFYLYEEKGSSVDSCLVKMPEKLDVDVAACWLEYCQNASTEGLRRKDTLDFLDFKLSVAEYLILTKKPSEQSEGNLEQSDCEEEEAPPLEQRKVQPVPDRRVRTVGVGNIHLPVFTKQDKKTRSKFRFPKCVIRNRGTFSCVNQNSVGQSDGREQKDLVTPKTMGMNEWVFVLLAGLLAITSGLPSVVKIGAIFTEDQKHCASELAFEYAVDRINRDKTLLPHTLLSHNIQYVPVNDSFHANKMACQQVELGIHSIFGPSEPLLGTRIHSICDALDIPHLEARLDFNTDVREFSINLYPAHYLLNDALQDVMVFLNWTRIAIIYENEYGLLKLRELMRSNDGSSEIYLHQANPESYQTVLEDIKNKEIHNIVIDTKATNMEYFLKGILQLQMNDYKYHYLLTTFDMETLDLEDFKYNFVNMTAFRIVNIEDLPVREVLRDMVKFQAGRKHQPMNSSYIQSEAALMYDSVYVFAVGLQMLEQSHSLQLTDVSCDREQPWDGGLSLVNYINAVELKGLSGPIEFKEGKRVQFKLDLLKLKRHSMVKVGEWQPDSGVNITDRAAFFDPGMMNVTLVVTTILVSTDYIYSFT
ncbi:hypothetical protein JTB14_009173 [Gonioctena quinquepunctata]|nr:hypothetical protein JTB14_009173 [Gonioctena quinquepunctata]